MNPFEILYNRALFLEKTMVEFYANLSDETIKNIQTEISAIKEVIRIYKENTQNLDNQKESLPTIDIVETEDLTNQKELYEQSIFDVQSIWETLDKNAKNIILIDIKKITNNGLSKTEMESLKMLAEDGEYNIEEILAKVGEHAFKYYGALDKLVEKGIAKYDNHLHQNIFLTETGLWLYGLTTHKNPVILNKI